MPVGRGVVMAKNYYLILGVPFDVAPDALRSAYRRLALRHHPDRGGASGSRPFREISEAYHVLSDPLRRARHDRELERVGRPRPAAAPAREVAPEPPTSEPITIGHPGEEVVRPSWEALFARIAHNFGAAGTTKWEHAEPLTYELILSREEAERGVRVPFRLPVFHVCYRCGGSGREWVFPCADCGGKGHLTDRENIAVNVPPDVRDGTTIEVSLERLGIANLWLRLLVRVDG